MDDPLGRFEAVCRTEGIPENWEPYLPNAEDPEWLEQLVDLCRFCLEICSALPGLETPPADDRPDEDPRRADHYLGRFPELGGSDRCVAELKAWELYIRGEREVGYLAPRYEAVREQLASRLQAFRREYGEEAIEALQLPKVAGYAISGILGTGGMGVVYKAYQSNPPRQVALKVIRNGEFASDDALQRFQNEVEAVAQLDHRNIVPIYEVGGQGKVRYFSMKLVEGDSLATKTCNDPQTSARLVAEIAEAIHHAHQRAVLHRDLKPHNILIDASGDPYVVDFGLAKRVEIDAGMTQSGTILGTPAYMAPEQVDGRPGDVTVATDVYGLGAILYHLLTGRAPFERQTLMETLDAVRQREPESPRKSRPNVPRDLETICLTCLAKDPNRRYGSAQQLADDLRRWLGSRPIKARRVGLLERICLWSARRPAHAALALTLIVTPLLLVAVAIYLMRLNETDRINLKVNSLTTASPSELTHILSELREEKARASEIIGHRLKVDIGVKAEPATAWRYRLAHFDLTGLPEQIGPLMDYLPQAQAGELAIIVGTLASRPSRTSSDGVWGRHIERLWGIIRNGQYDTNQKFKAAVALAKLDPSSQRWATVSANVGDWLVQRNPIELTHYVSILEEVADSLVPHLLIILGDAHRDDVHRTVAANVLVEYARKAAPNKRSSIQAEMLFVADERRFVIFRAGLSAFDPDVVNRLIQELAKPSPAEDASGRWAMRKANAAICLIYLSERWPKLVLPLLRDAESPSLRTFLVTRMHWLGDRTERLIEALERDSVEPAALQSILEGLGTFDEEDGLARRDGNAFRKTIESLYREHRDPGVHASAGLLLHRRFGPDATDALDKSLAITESQREAHLPPRTRGPTWYIARSADPNDPYPMTMVTIRRPGTVEIAPIDDESLAADAQTRRREFHRRLSIERDFAVAAFEITLGEFRRFSPEHPHRDIHGPGGRYPVNSVSWYKALEYCQWLNEQHGISQKEWCFPPGTIFDPAERDRQNLPPLEFPQDYLHKKGYRLLTEAEWEYACRAGTTTSRYFGPIDLMSLYASYPGNSKAERMEPVGSFLPNRLGLHDMLGNAMEWTLEPNTKWKLKDADEAVHVIVDDEFPVTVSEELKNKHIARGGSFYNPPSRIRASYRYFYQPMATMENIGFRIGRTL